MNAMMEFKPADGIEGMMAAQAVGLHSAAMECLRRAMIPDQPGQVADQLRRQSANLSRAFLDVVAALDRKRGKGVRQVVRVERVMVAAGGQAVVGNVQAGGAGNMQHGEGVGHDEGTGREPHATPARLAHDATLGAVLPRCGAMTRAGAPCRSPAMPNGRCRMHGGTSTGPRTAAGLARVRRTHTVHGLYGAEMRELRRNCGPMPNGGRKISGV